MAETPLLQLQEVAKSFDGKVLFEHVNMELRAGEIAVIVGPSGVGKSTLLRMISGLIPYEGDIFIKGQRVEFDPSASGSQMVTMVTQKPGLWEHLRVIDNVALVRRLVKGEPESVARNHAREILSKFEVDALSEKYPATLSGGEQQRVAIARGFATERPLLLLDEVTANVDSRRREMIAQAISIVSRSGVGVVLVTHDVAFGSTLTNHLSYLGQSGMKK